MDLLQKFQDHWQNRFCQLSTARSRLLLAVSGGVDSVVLVDLVARSGFDFVIAHCNFQLRGGESMRDEDFVKSLGEKYDKEILVKRFDTNEYALDQKISIQEAARDLRYEWFMEIVDGWKIATEESPKNNKPVNHQSSSANCILTAHHADDNIETLLMHFFRGTGINGLTGIPAETRERRLSRPLLPFRKKEILGYAKERELKFVEDSSNASDKYTRNFFRNQLLPQIREVYPQVEENLLNNINRLQETAELYRQSIDLHLHKLLEQKGAEWHVPVLKWKKVRPLHSITWELIKPFGFHAAQTEEVIKLLDAHNGTQQSSSTHRIIRNRNWMIISPNAADISQHILIEDNEPEVFFENGKLQIDIQDPKSAIQNNLNEAYLNAGEITFPLLLRKWKTGDYFYPLGMQKKKKINRFLIDQKLSRTEKERTWVIESNKKIVWVIGCRIDNRFRITDKVKKVIKISLVNKQTLP